MLSRRGVLDAMIGAALVTQGPGVPAGAARFEVNYRRLKATAARPRGATPLRNGRRQVTVRSCAVEWT